MKPITELLGERILYRQRDHTVKDGVVREISGSGDYVKIGNDPEWHAVLHVTVLEVLPSQQKQAKPGKEQPKQPELETK